MSRIGLSKSRVIAWKQCPKKLWLLINQPELMTYSESVDQRIGTGSYESFAYDQRPFVNGSTGYFKMNLYPIGFKNTDPELWKSEFSKITGFENKIQYVDWCKSERFSIMRSWATKSVPKLIVCFGKTYLDDFKLAFLDNPSLASETILDRNLSWAINKDGTLVAICPFPVNRHGLNSNLLLQLFGERIRQLISN